MSDEVHPVDGGPQGSVLVMFCWLLYEPLQEGGATRNGKTLPSQVPYPNPYKNNFHIGFRPTSHLRVKLMKCIFSLILLRFEDAIDP